MCYILIIQEKDGDGNSFSILFHILVDIAGIFIYNIF